MTVDWAEELRRGVERAGEAPLRLTHPATREEFVVLRAEVYERLRRLLQAEQIDPSFYEFEEKDGAK